MVDVTVQDERDATANCRQGILGLLANMRCVSVIGPQQAMFRIGDVAYMYVIYKTSRSYVCQAKFPSDEYMHIIGEFEKDMVGRLVYDQPVVWRVMPEMTNADGLWTVYCRFVQVPTEDAAVEAMIQAGNPAD